MPLRLAFMGTPGFVVPPLAALVASPHLVVAVYTQPPRPSGRGHKLQKSAVHEFAEARGILVRHPDSLKPQEEKDSFAALDLDCAIVSGYGLILPRAILEAPRHGCLNIHVSLLPRWRGAAPVQHAILAGDEITGTTIMQMEPGMDTGPILNQYERPIEATDTSPLLYDALFRMGAENIVQVMESFIDGTIQPQPQPEDGVTYADKLTREDGKLDFTQPARDLDRRIRALLPWPGAFFDWRGETIKVAAANLVEGTGKPGELLDRHLTVACGVGALRLLKVQRPGKSWQEGAEFLRGFGGEPGDMIS